MLIWNGIIKSTYAKAKGGLLALSLANRARADFEAALAGKPDGFSSVAYANLGVLYYRMPRWPFSFGDDRKAEQLLRRALALDPEDRDGNYYYGCFLIDNGRYDEAARYLHKAQRRPPRTGHLFIDNARQAEIRDALLLLAGH